MCVHARIEFAAWEKLRSETLSALESAGSARELAAEFSSITARLEQSSVSPREGSARGRMKAEGRLLSEEAALRDLKAAASSTGISASRFSRVFKDESGEGFGSFRRRKRLDQAALLLGQGDMPIWRVAQECGYRSASHFTQVFQRQFGKTPVKWRQENSK